MNVEALPDELTDSEAALQAMRAQHAVTPFEDVVIQPEGKSYTCFLMIGDEVVGAVNLEALMLLGSRC